MKLQTNLKLIQIWLIYAVSITPNSEIQRRKAGALMVWKQLKAFHWGVDSLVINMMSWLIIPAKSVISMDPSVTFYWQSFGNIITLNELWVFMCSLSIYLWWKAFKHVLALLQGLAGEYLLRWLVDSKIEFNEFVLCKSVTVCQQVHRSFWKYRLYSLVDTDSCRHHGWVVISVILPCGTSVKLNELTQNWQVHERLQGCHAHGLMMKCTLLWSMDQSERTLAYSQTTNL